MSAHATPDPHAASTVTPSSTPDVKKSEVVKIIVVFALFIIVLMASTILYFSKKGHASNKNKAETEIQGTGNVSSTPSHYTEYHTLKKGEVVRVNIPQGYKCDYYGGGKKYYHQAQNCEKEIWGGGSCPTGLGNPNASYADLSVYEEEITVRCEFSIKK